MALEFFDGFDHYNNATNLQRKWDGGSSSFSFPAGRFGGGAFVPSGNPGAIKTLTSVATRTLGAAINVSGLVNSILIQFRDAGSNQVEVNLKTTGALTVTRNGTVLGTSANVLSINTWYYVEFQATIDPTVGTYDVHINGVSWLNGSGQNTRNTANSSTNQICIGGSGISVLYDDLYVLNSSGSVNNTFLGESRILTNEPNADDTAATGTNLLWTPNSGTAHFSRVNEANPDDDTSYVSSATAGQIDTYKFAAISPSGSIAAVQIDLCERKDDVGARTTCVEYRGGGSNFDGANNFSPTSGYLIDRQIYETDPATSAAWTTSGVNAGEFGVKCLA